MNAESDSKIRTVKLKNAMEHRPSQDRMLQLQRHNHLLAARIQELEASAQVRLIPPQSVSVIISQQMFGYAVK
jgi:hypothetical protein